MKIITLGIAAGTLILASIGYYAADRTAVQRWFVFYVWKSISGKSHGGQCVRIRDICIYYETYGVGPPTLVLHGGFGSIEGMSYQIMELAKTHFVVAVDSRGHGRSSDGDAPLSYALMADDMANLLDHLQIRQVDVVGWSDGAIIGLDMALRYAERVRRLVAISANYDVNGLSEASAESTANPVTEAPPVPLRYRLLAPDPTHWPAFYRKVLTMWNTQPHYTLDDLRRIKCPTLIMAGEFDIVRREHTDQLARAIPNSEELIIRDATHSMPTDKPEEVNSNIIRFLGP